MKPIAIVYTSETGHTARYAALLGEQTGLPVYALDEARKALPKKTRILYLGWLFASKIKGYKKASRRFTVCGICGVGLCTTGALLGEVRKANAIPDEIPLFTVQGGMDHGKLRGINKSMIQTLTKFMLKKKDKTDGEKEMLRLLQTGGDFVCVENLSSPLAWCASLTE